MALLSVDRLSVHAEREEGSFRLLKNVSLEIEKGEWAALLGPSGCGKTTLANAIMGFLKADTFCDYGTVEFAGIVNVPKQIGLDFLDNDPFADVRGRRMAYVMQNVREAFDPTARIGSQIEELFEESSFFERKKKTAAFLKQACVSDAKKISRLSAQEASVGELQKIMIMMALERRSELIILDEPFSALDPLSRRQMIAELKKDENLSVLLITHEPEAVRQLCTSCIFMTGGTVSEKKQTKDLSDRDMTDRLDV